MYFTFTQMKTMSLIQKRSKMSEMLFIVDMTRYHVDIQSSRAALQPGHTTCFHLRSKFPWWNLAGRRPSRTGSSFLLHLVPCMWIFIPLPGCWCSGSLPAGSCYRRGDCTGCIPRTQLSWVFANVDTRPIYMTWEMFSKRRKGGSCRNVKLTSIHAETIICV